MGLENLKAVLTRLPRGEEVTWIGAGWLAGVGAPRGNIQLLGPEMIQEIERHCLGLDRQLQVAD